MMHHTPYHLRHREPIYIGFERPPTVNRLGIAGFILSLLSLLFTFGLLSPFGLLLSAFGLLSKPRRMALAGLLLGLLGTAFWALIFLGLCLGWDQAEKVPSDVTAHDGRARSLASVLQQNLDQIQRYRLRHNGRAPGGIEGNKLVVEHKDKWGTPLRYEIYDEVIAVRSAGPDAKFETADDIAIGNKIPSNALDPLDTCGQVLPDVRIR